MSEESLKLARGTVGNWCPWCNGGPSVPCPECERVALLLDGLLDENKQLKAELEATEEFTTDLLTRRLDIALDLLKRGIERTTDVTDERATV